MKSDKFVGDAITAPVLLLVEGKDEEYLLGKMCEQWFKERAKKIDIECVDGLSNFSRKIKVLEFRTQNPLKILKVVGVIADSEQDPVATAQSWMNLFNEVEPKINIPCRKLQLPSDNESGAFETLILSALTDDAIAKCAMSFRDCVKPHLENRTIAQGDKIAVQAWLSAKLGRAYNNLFKAQGDHSDKQFLDYDHAAFLPIKSFIETLLAQAEAGVTQP